MRHQQQTGFALISALIVLALVTGVTVAMAVNQRNGVDLATDVIRYGQLHQHGDGILLWSKGVLYEDIKNNNSDSVNDIWNQPLVDVEIDGGEIDAVIIDLQSKFNINDLALQGDSGEISRSRFARLLRIVGVENNITDAVVDWVDTNTETRFPNGAEDDHYLSLEKPYRAANQPMQSVSELLLVKGVALDTYEKLLPYVTVLPVGVGINVNTASDEVLLTLSDKMDSFAVNEIKEIITESPITQIMSPETSTNNTEGDSVAENGEEMSEYCRSLTWTAQRKSCQKQENEKVMENNNTLFNNQPAKNNYLSDNSVISTYEINTEGLNTSSNYFQVTGQVTQHNRRMIYSYNLFRDSLNGKVMLLAKNNKGVARE